MKPQLYNYKCELVRVVDGDTVEALVDLGFDTWTKRFIDFSDLDAPEIMTKDEQEKIRGFAAKIALEELMTPIFYVISEEYDSFGRSTAVIVNDNGVDVGKEMVKLGFCKKDRFTIKGHNVILGKEL